ncbi:MAG TPA: amidohydrolase family protein [Gemmatimonadales bacterium]
MNREPLKRLGLAALAAAGFVGCGKSRPEPATVIANVLLFDGSGGEPFVTSVRIIGDRIDAIGDEAGAKPDQWFIDGAGLALAPGFIDTHSHADYQLEQHRDALGAVSQGITTVVVGQDGGSPSPLGDFFARLDSAPAAVNIAAYSGHNTLRHQVLGEDFRRAATQVEVDSMKLLLLADFDAGGLGLSTGLEYDPGIYSSRREVLDLAAAVGAEGGRYISHIRSEDRAFWDAIDEAIAIGREARLPVQISHLKLAMRSLWGRADSLLGVLDAARQEGIEITADVYPYTYWQSTLTVLFPERNYRDRSAAEFALREVAAPGGLLLGRFAPNSTYVGRTLADIARQRRTDPATTLMGLIAEAEAFKAAQPAVEDVESVIGISMDERDVERLLAWPYANICTDGELAGRHPRGFGAFPKVLGVYARQRRAFSTAEAVRKMTSLPARNMGIRDRGVVRAGGFADLVLLDTLAVLDNATTAEPQRTASGIRRVWVNGQVVYEDGKVTGRYPGRPLRRGQTQTPD